MMRAVWLIRFLDLSRITKRLSLTFLRGSVTGFVLFAQINKGKPAHTIHYELGVRTWSSVLVGVIASTEVISSITAPVDDRKALS